MKSTFPIIVCFIFFTGLNKFNAQTLEWAKSFGGTSADISTTIVVDQMGNVYTTGFFKGTVDFDPSTEISNLNSNGNDDVFVQKMDADGNFLWAKSFGGISRDIARCIIVDKTGNVYTTGYYSGTVDFNPSEEFGLLTSEGENDIFIQKLDSSGNFIWVKSIGGPTSDEGSSIALDASGNIYSTGYFTGTVDFDIGTGTNSLTSAGFADI